MRFLKRWKGHYALHRNRGDGLMNFGLSDVLPLVDHVNQSVTNFTYLLIMARLLAAMINDYEEYILCYVNTFV